MQLTFGRISDVMGEISLNKKIITRDRVSHGGAAFFRGLRVNSEPQTLGLDGLAEVRNIFLQALLERFKG